MAKPKKKAAAKVRNPRSAAAALGGKMSKRTVRLAITNIHMDGDYTGTIHLGSRRKACNVIFDTGSSTLAIDGSHYDVTGDRQAKITSVAQEVGYADGSNWVGGVALTEVMVGERKLKLPGVPVAIAYHTSNKMFGSANGILGLAYSKLNPAFTMPGPTLPPHYTYNQIQNGLVSHLEPYFAKLEDAGLVANKFAFYTRRSMVRKAHPRPVSDPANHGFLILGGGEEHRDLYQGRFQVARVVHDLYYNTNLKAILVGKSDPIHVHPPTKASGAVSNSFVDSGTNIIRLEQSLFNGVVERLSKFANPTLTDSIRAGYVAMSQLHLSAWPTITFVLEGALGKDVKLEVKPETYWQTDAPKAGYATAVLQGDNGQGGGQSILGLPLMNNYLTVFDRSVDRGMGVISFAKIK
jgi:hypothetical protein